MARAATVSRNGAVTRYQQSETRGHVETYQPKTKRAQSFQDVQDLSTASSNDILSASLSRGSDASSTMKRAVSFGPGDSVVVTIHEYKSRQKTTACWYKEDCLERLYNHEVTINWRGDGGAKSQNMHRCWRGLEHVQGRYDKGARTSNYVQNMLALQENLRSNIRASKTEESRLKVSLTREMKSASRLQTKENRRRALHLGMQDEQASRQDLSELYSQIERKQSVRRASRFSLSPRRSSNDGTSVGKPLKSSLSARGISASFSSPSLSTLT